VKRFVFPGIFVAAGGILLLTSHEFRIRGTEVNFGWLLVGAGGLSLLWEAARRKK
jgi:hypothetical protein